MPFYRICLLAVTSILIQSILGQNSSLIVQIEDLRRQGKYDEAIRLGYSNIEQSGGDRAESVSLLNALGRVRTDQKRYDLAAALYRKSLQVIEQLYGVHALSYASTLFELAKVNGKSGDLRTAEKDLETVLKLTRDSEARAVHLVALTELSRLYVEAGRYSKAEPLANEVAAIAMSSGDEGLLASAEYEQGRVLYGMGKLEEANEHYRKALKAFETTKNYSGISLVYNNLAALYIRQGDWNAADGILTQGAKGGGVDPVGKASLHSNFLNNLGVLNAFKKDYPRAFANFKQAKHYSPNDWVTDYNLAALYTVTGDDRKAESQLKKIVNAASSAPEVPESLALLEAREWKTPASKTLNWRFETPAMLTADMLTSDEIERYPTIETPSSTKPGQAFNVTVALRIRKPKSPVTIAPFGGTQLLSDGKLRFVLPSDKQSWDIGVILLTPIGFQISGPDHQTIKLPRDDSSTDAVFHLTYVAKSNPPSAATLQALFVDGTQPLARVECVIKIDNTASPRPSVDRGGVASVADKDSRIAEGSPPAPPSTVEVTANPVIVNKPPESSESADVTLYHIEHGTNCLTVLLTPRNYYPQLPCTSTNDPSVTENLLNNYKEIMTDAQNIHMMTSDSSPAEIQSAKEQLIARVKGFGRRLSEMIFPNGGVTLVEALERAKQSIAGRSDKYLRIQIFTSNPLVPWEVLVLPAKDGSPGSNYLGIDYVVARLPESSRSYFFPDDLEFKELDVIAPSYTNPLIYQAEEVQALSSNPGYHRILGSFAAVSEIFKNPPAGIIHFAGHGAATQTGYAIALENDVNLNLDTVRGLNSTAMVNRPLFFLNACELGRTTRLRDFIDGWGPDVLKYGASGLIGGMWPLYDSGAADFSKSFYKLLNTRLANGPVNVAALIRQGREKFNSTGDPTYLSYVFYGNVLFKVRRQSPKSGSGIP